MNEYMFYTFEGFTQSPDKNNCENLQILGFEKAENLEIAKKCLLANNDWISKHGFDTEKILSKKILTEESLASIKTVVDYLWKDEEKDYEECLATNRDVDNHIFKHLRKLKLITSDNQKILNLYTVLNLIEELIITLQQFRFDEDDLDEDIFYDVMHLSYDILSFDLSCLKLKSEDIAYYRKPFIDIFERIRSIIHNYCELFDADNIFIKNSIGKLLIIIEKLKNI